MAREAFPLGATRDGGGTDFSLFSAGDIITVTDRSVMVLRGPNASDESPKTMR